MNPEVRPARKEIEAMCSVMHHRGPDGSGVFIDGQAALGHRRLSIIDLAAGAQPMANEDGLLQIVFNGEIYNHAELRKGLEAQGHRYATHCDTESIIHLYEQEGKEGVRKLRGMFAFAIWNRRAKELFCVRDRLGVKPLYYTIQEKRFLFASEIKALLELPYVKRRVNRKKLPEFFAFGYVSGPETLFEDIYKLMPGHWLSWRDGIINIQRYWELRAVEAGRERSIAEHIEEFRALFTESVRLRLMSDVPLGAFLSGGLDSSAIVAVMSQLTGGERLKTFSVGFAERKYDELDYARQVAKHYKTDHYEVVLDSRTFFEKLPALTWHEDEPLVWSSSVSLYLVSKLASEHVKVVLTGEGSDETLGGYERYWATLWNRRLGTPYWKLMPSILQKGIRRVLDTSALPTGIGRKLRHSFLYWSPSMEDLYFSNLVANFTRTTIQCLLAPDYCEGDPFETALSYAAEAPTTDQLGRLLYTDIRTYLVELLMKQDQMSMATSIESRVPFLDHRLVETVWAMPSHAKLRGRNSKYVLRRAMEGVLPPAILTRRKRGFPTPLPPWMRKHHDAIQAILLDRRVAQRGILRPEAVRSLLELHESGVRNCTFQLWRLLTFELWCRVFFDQDGGVYDTEAMFAAAG